MSNEYERLLIDLVFDPLVSTEVSLKIMRELRRIKKEIEVEEKE